MRGIGWLGAVLLVVCSMPGSAALPQSLQSRYQAQPLVLEFPDGLRPSVATALKAIVSEAYGRLGLEVTYRVLPSRRGLRELKLETVDGSVARTRNVLPPGAPYLIVPTPVATGGGFYAFYRKGFEFSGWQGQRIVSLRGAAQIEKWAEAQELPIEMVSTSKQALAMVASAHADIAIVIEPDPSLTATYLENGVLTRSNGPVLKATAYTILHEKHADLIPFLDETLREMKDDGFTDEVYRKYMPMSEYSTQ